MPFPIAPDRIAQLIGAPAQNVAAYWPLLEAALASLGAASNLACVAALATVRVECPPFKPALEKYNGTPEEYFKRYDNRPDLGNTTPGDGLKFRGRGFIQITGKANYQHYGAALGVDMFANPDAALDPTTAAAIFALYFRDHHVAAAAEAKDWERVRKLVNGGLNGFAAFSAAVDRLLEELSKTGHAGF